MTFGFGEKRCRKNLPLCDPMPEHFDEKPFVYPDAPQSTEDEFFGDAWSVRHIDGAYFFSYMSGELAGRHKQIPISAADYLAARAGEIDGDGLCIKYGIH